ncbi:class I SAM-dependent methyltransferase [Leptolyngbya sp. KIOST-1]|uniref:class I SAM-dependent methyltransferase n=1 Tax=Leptolyngbya sp. KIOST-1 TaxID=1229172 RepID=UPI000563C302|nr:class I SAM-dependent methyltransferase [Leptolyngbya sp. KIOST-1]
MTKTPTDYEYAYQSPTSEHHHHYLAPPVLQVLTDLQQNNAEPLKLLDLGCGNGSFSSFLAGQGFVVTGIEESASGIAQAQQAYPNCQFHQGSIYDLDFTDLSQAFDVVFSAEVIEHLFYPKELVRVAKQCLRPGGTLILTTPYHGYLKNLALAFTGKMDRHFTALWDGGHIKFFSVPTLRQLVLSEGFINPKFQFAGRFPYLWKSMVCAATLSTKANAS